MHNATATDNHILKAKQAIVKVKCEIECYTRGETKETIMTTKMSKLLFTMENATTAGSSQSNISRIYI